MKIPNKIKVGGKEYTIKFKRRVDLTNKNVIGQVNYSTQTLTLQKGFKDDRENEDNFFHEVSHAVLRELEFNHPKLTAFRNNEDLIKEMSLVLRTTFLDLLEKQK